MFYNKRILVAIISNIQTEPQFVKEKYMIILDKMSFSWWYKKCAKYSKKHKNKRYYKKETLQIFFPHTQRIRKFLRRKFLLKDNLRSFRVGKQSSFIWIFNFGKQNILSTFREKILQNLFSFRCYITTFFLF